MDCIALEWASKKESDKKIISLWLNMAENRKPKKKGVFDDFKRGLNKTFGTKEEGHLQAKALVKNEEDGKIKANETRKQPFFESPFNTVMTVCVALGLVTIILATWLLSGWLSNMVFISGILLLLFPGYILLATWLHGILKLLVSGGAVRVVEKEKKVQQLKEEAIGSKNKKHTKDVPAEKENRKAEYKAFFAEVEKRKRGQKKE